MNLGHEKVGYICKLRDFYVKICLKIVSYLCWIALIDDLSFYEQNQPIDKAV